MLQIDLLEKELGKAQRTLGWFREKSIFRGLGILAQTAEILVAEKTVEELSWILEVLTHTEEERRESLARDTKEKLYLQWKTLDERRGANELNLHEYAEEVCQKEAFRVIVQALTKALANPES